MSLFVAGAAFGDLGVSLFMAGAVFGDLGVSLFAAGAVFGEIWVDSRSTICCNFQYKMRLQSSKSNLVERAGARWRSVFGSWSDHGRIGRPRTANDTSTVLGKLLSDFGMQFCQYLVRLEGDAYCSAHCK